MTREEFIFAAHSILPYSFEDTNAALDRALTLLENAPPALQEHLTLDVLCTAVALDYVRFRLPQLLPAQRYPQLHAWLAQALQQPHLHATRFEG